MRYTPATLLFALATLAISTTAQPAPPPLTTTTTTTSSSSSSSASTAAPTNDASPPSIPPVTFESNACSQCTFASIPKEPSCAALVPVDMQLLQSLFTPTSVNIGGLFTAIKNPAIKNCVCHWASGTYNQTTNGAAATCLTTEPAVPGPVPAALGGAQGAAVAPCNATQASEAQTQFSMLGAVVHCDAIVSHTTGRPASETPAAGSSSASRAQWIGGWVSVGAVVLAVVTAL